MDIIIVIFVIATVVSSLARAANQRAKTQGAQPARRVMTPQGAAPVRDLPEGFSASEMPKPARKPETKSAPEPAFSQLAPRPAALPSVQAAAQPAGELRAPAPKFTQSDLMRGVVMSEILAKPVSLRGRKRA